MIKSILLMVAALFLLAGTAYADSYTLHNKAETDLLIRSAAIKIQQGSTRKDFELRPGESKTVNLGEGFHMVQLVIYNKANMGENFFYDDMNLTQPETKWLITVEPGIKVKMQMQ